jgi:hypothetical protein
LSFFAITTNATSSAPLNETTAFGKTENTSARIARGSIDWNFSLMSAMLLALIMVISGLLFRYFAMLQQATCQLRTGNPSTVAQSVWFRLASIAWAL